jgi:SAM-dependent methyltransferase
LYLSEETPLTIEDSNGSRALSGTDNSNSVTWRTVAINVIPRLALVITVGSRVVFEPTKVNAGDVGLITFGPTQGDFIPDGLRVVVWFRFVDGIVSMGTAGTEIELFSERIPGFDPRRPWVEYQFRLDEVVGTTGSFIVECTSASRPRPRKGELALYEFVVSDERSLDLNRARAFKQLRMRNEKANFDAYYQHSIFQKNVSSGPNDHNTQVDAASDTARVSRIRPSPTDQKNSFSILLKRFYRAITGECSTGQARDKEHSISQEAPIVGPTNAFSYSHDLLLKKLNLTPPPFGWRLQTKLREFNSASKADMSSKFRVLSLCSGAARIEADIIRGLPAERLSMTLLDMNPDLLNTAKQRLSEWCEVEGILGDVNELDLQGEKFDIIMCVSGLHHVVELEHLIEAVADGLSDTGEFWSIGETVGRNGGRLWQESYEVANAFFSKLDKKYRINRMTGLNSDDYLPDMDYSIGCFEGIRCEAIEPTLSHYLSPVNVCKHNCIIWKLFSLSYSDNYDMRCPEDLALIEEAVDLDSNLFRRGGRPIELNGIYERRRAAGR